VKLSNSNSSAMLPFGVKVNMQAVCEFSADGQYLLLNRNSVDGNPFLIDLAHRSWYPLNDILEQVAPRMVNMQLRCRFSGDGKVLAIHEQTVRRASPFLLYDLAASQILYASPAVADFVFSPLSPLVVTLNSKSALEVRDYTRNQLLHTKQLEPVMSSWSVGNAKNGQYLQVSDGNSQSVYIMDYKTLSWRKSPLYEKDNDSEVYLVEGSLVGERTVKGQRLLYSFARNDIMPITLLRPNMAEWSLSLKRLYYVGTDTALHVVGLPELKLLRSIKTGISRPIGIVTSNDDSTVFVFNSLGRTSELNVESGAAALLGRTGFGIEEMIGDRLGITILQGNGTKNKRAIVSRAYLKMNKEQKLFFLKKLYKIP
jgi:hypothetical protein